MRRLLFTLVSLVILSGLHYSVYGLDNGLALTPPVGWLSWERFGCETDCVAHPDTCISERLYTDMADVLIRDGYKDVGYEYVNIDDCWSARGRDQKTGEILPDPQRFPHGIKWLADYMHRRGLKLGLYADIGTYTCGGYPGLEGHFEQDIKTFAEWGIDSLKVDGCYADPTAYGKLYPELGRILNATNRPILYSCSWPAYLPDHGEKNDVLVKEIAPACNLWRNYGDIYDSWAVVLSITNFWARNSPTNVLVRAAGPGHWNDPDMVLVGNNGLSLSEQESHFALWATIAAPLYMAADLRRMPSWARTIVKNKMAISLNQGAALAAARQDSANRLSMAPGTSLFCSLQGYVVWSEDGVRIWIKELRGTDRPGDTWAVPLQNTNDMYGPKRLVLRPAEHIPGWEAGTRMYVPCAVPYMFILSADPIVGLLMGYRGMLTNANSGQLSS
ncbi:hypothetical protein FOZ61_008279 [Perkinsus olseni]|uniref:Alpha-galactosidase n=1 Tax=Perkinsus olseni TaxID=32597 RepID=A0A7J6M7F4_PEROL|nr:hypothetical protein FOL46_006214 [Perkinsus olseni]KAF4667419.1 hypothetical protein FOZ61_008279 [Perkinsus olseni]